MAKETKIIKGGFRATLALIISIVALVLAFLAYSSTEREESLRARIRDLQTGMETMRQETSKKMENLRDDTANALERLGKTIKKEGQTED